jgi:Na+-transporting NADH:ubiquinone oxidoreductase subunit A|tara:strand:+ start:18834 stop:20165 length:1332 start_codon:yes stop_codon:yes gene_type:complete
MQKIKIKKGHNINISGLASRNFSSASNPKFVSISPLDFNYIKPKMLVKEGEAVSMGDALFFDKNNPEVKWPAFASGIISKIVYGERRAVQEIIIEVDIENENDISSVGDLNSSSRANIKKFISENNMWPFITQRPFNKVANPEDEPKCIVISLADSSPLASDLSFSLDERRDDIVSALSVLKKLTDGHLYVAVRGDNFSYLSECDFVNLIQIEGPHPSGNVGVILNKVNPLNQNEVVWTVQGSHLPILGKLFSKGKYDFSININVAGPAVTPSYYKSRMGVQFDCFKDSLKMDKVRIISGNVLTGKRIEMDRFLGFYHSTFSVIEESHERPFIGWLHPGGKTKYSVFNAYFGSNNNSFDFTTLQNGSNRAFVPVDAWEKVFPMNIYINSLARSIEANDVDEMEKLGIYECDEEDVALCSFVCPSKSDVGSIIRKGLNTIYFDK